MNMWRAGCGESRTSGSEDGPGRRAGWLKGRNRALVRSYENVMVWSVDEKTGIQAKSRVNPTRPAVPAGHVEADTTPARGRPVRQEFEYKRNGTAMLFAALNVHGGEIAGWVAESSKSENFVAFLGDLIEQTPAGLDLHCICDNLSAHKSAVVKEFLERPENSHVHLHYTPTHASWLNQVELFFSIMQRRLLRRGEFSSVDELTDKIIAFINDYNRRAKPYKWTYAGRPLQVA